MSFQDDPASGPVQATSATRRHGRIKTPATAHSAQAGIFKRRIRLNWAPAVDLDTLMGVLGTSAMRRIVCLCFWAPGTQPPTASACPLALGPLLFFHCPAWPRFNDAMPVLTRRRNLEASDECRQICFGDVRVGTIAIRTGNPHDTDPWEWWCGFYPGSHPREHQSGTAATFNQARADFEAASRVFLSNRTEADLQAWRDERD